MLEDGSRRGIMESLGDHDRSIAENENGRVPSRTNSLLMLLEPRQGGKAKRIVRNVTKNQTMPGSCLVESAHLFAQIRKTMVKFRMRLKAERLFRLGLEIERQRLLEGCLVSYEYPVDSIKFG